MLARFANSKHPHGSHRCRIAAPVPISTHWQHEASRVLDEFLMQPHGNGRVTKQVVLARSVEHIDACGSRLFTSGVQQGAELRCSPSASSEVSSSSAGRNAQDHPNSAAVRMRLLRERILQKGQAAT